MFTFIDLSFLLRLLICLWCFCLNNITIADSFNSSRGNVSFVFRCVGDLSPSVLEIAMQLYYIVAKSINMPAAFEGRANRSRLSSREQDISFLSGAVSRVVVHASSHMRLARLCASPLLRTPSPPLCSPKCLPLPTPSGHLRGSRPACLPSIGPARRSDLLPLWLIER